MMACRLSPSPAALPNAAAAAPMHTESQARSYITRSSVPAATRHQIAPRALAPSPWMRTCRRVDFAMPAACRHVATPASDLRKGDIVEFKGKTYTIGKTEKNITNRKPFNICEMRDIETGKTRTETLRGEEKLEKIFVTTAKMQLLYIEGDRAYLQDEETFEQMDLSVGTLGVARYYLEDGDSVQVDLRENGVPVVVRPPLKMQGEVEQVEAPRDQKSQYKKSTLTNGRVVMVPGFINEGETILVSMEDETYVERVA